MDSGPDASSANDAERSDMSDYLYRDEDGDHRSTLGITYRQAIGVMSGLDAIGIVPCVLIYSA
jgi:hypothetical protein